MKEEGEGALQDAISLYSQVADNTGADQSIRAKALLHIGMCYEKMGTREAVKAYQRLVNNFPTQQNEIEIARKRLNHLLLADKSAEQEKKKDLLIRKVLPDTEIEPLGTPSPDGRFISFIDWKSGGNICILNLETREKRCLTDFKDPNELLPYYSSWSPDGKQIAYFWWRYDKDQYNLSVVDVQKAESRDLLISDKYDWIELGNWSSDGMYIFATLSLREEPKSQIVRVSSANGTLEVLHTLNETYTGGKPYVSPDNRYLAFDLPDKNASGNSDIYILSLETGKENALVMHPSHDYILGWSPEGKHILFATDRTGTVDAMIIAVKEGKAAGNPKPIKQNVGPIVPMGFTQDGSFYYGQWPGGDNIYAADINLNEGKLESKPTLLVQRFEGRNYSPAYSSDGKYLAYLSLRGVMKKGKQGTVLCIRNLETGEELEVTPDLQISGNVSNLTWSPDNHSLALTCKNKEDYSRIYGYEIKSRQFLPLVLDSNGQPQDVEYTYPIWSKDGKSIFYLQLSRHSQTSRIMERNLITGADRELYNYTSEDFMDRIVNISLSPDGKWLAAINRGENRVVRLISTEDGETVELHKFKSPGGFPNTPVWSNDGKYIAFPFQTRPTNNYMSREWSMMRVSLDGGESHLIKMDIHGINSPTLHPDGRTIAFRSAGYSFPENNIWEMKYFLQSISG
ncbi:MAG: tetratricopeptide repeat protein, partial [Bacteroidales bacterium]